MQIGCGRTIKTIKDNQYLYFWWYENAGGRNVQKFTCLGKVDNPETTLKANRMANEYYVKSRRMLDELIEKTRERD
ncbi:MAG: hypothetical protein ACE5IO_01920 [Thermoplasmata archaeon]